MKATFEFDMVEEKDYFEMHCKCVALNNALSEMYDDLRSKIKHTEEGEKYEAIREYVSSFISDHIVW